MPVTLPQINSLLVHKTYDIVLTYLNCHVYNVFGIVITVAGGLVVVEICLFVCSQQLIVAGSYYYYCFSDNQWWLYTKVEEAGGLPSSRSTGRDR